MIYKALTSTQEQAISELFTGVFSASEGEDEGVLIGDLAAQLAASIDDQEILCFAAFDSKEQTLLATIFFTRLVFSHSPVELYMLAPVAVSTAHQGQGIGQALISYGLSELKKRSVAVAVTYGDPAFYSKVGFMPLSQEVLPAPLEPSIPEGWLGQSLSDQPIPSFNERPSCAQAFANPVYW